MTLEKLEVDALIIGGGILGLALTEAYAERGFKVLCLRLSDEGSPQAETLRNQGWLQSGARYYWKARAEENKGVKEARAAKEAAVGMVFSSRRIREDYPGLTGETAGAQVLRSSFQLPAAMQHGKLEDGMVVEELSFTPITNEADARRLCGDLATPFNRQIVETQERSFEEDRLLEILRHRAASNDAMHRVITEPASLLPDSGGQAQAIADGYQISAARIVVAAGVGSIDLANDLGLTLPLQVRRTPLLVVKNETGCQASVFQDSPNRFSVCWHRTEGEVEHGVIGCLPEDYQRRLFSFEEFRGATPRERQNRRRIPQEVVDQLTDHLPDAFGPKDTFTVRGGFELIPEGQLDWQPWIHQPEGFQNLVFASPGRATTAVDLAAEISRRDAIRLSPEVSFYGKSFPGRPWTEPIAMHYRDVYSALHEVK